ncbi:MAG: glycoside hydrolase/phage tail family protein [Asticcacaulis sp.]|uniref:baseplate multidomain protein megatron n=1 Tax=Asticcacaulis sp. TaxID=1872648 RepID=UPI0039E6EE9B
MVLSAVGTALGGPVGGWIGAQLGSAIDRTALNSLSPTRQVGSRLSGLQLTQSAQGDPVKQVYGKARVSGTLIWAARLKENRSTTRASKTSGKTESYSYTLSLAVALSEGPIDGIGRIWADGQLLDQSVVSYRLYRGEETQVPDSLIEAVEGTAPAYRGMAYLVFEDLDITQFGNRPPSLSVEVFRRPTGDFVDLESLIEGVCLIPGAGEFIYATEPNAVLSGMTKASYETQHTGDGRTDFMVSLDQLQAQLPNVKTVNLVVSWFGTSLDAATCTIRPGVEVSDKRTTPLSWAVDGITRAEAYVVSQQDGRPAYGGTPADAVVIAAITELKARGYAVTLIPFILMDCDGYPWRGRITSAVDMTVGAATAVSAFMDGEWGFRRFVKHCADLGAQAGGVDGLVLGSELRGLTTLRSASNTYPMVTALRGLAAEVRAILPDAQIGYGADWSEYFGHQPGDGTGHVSFHLDPLWADENIDFVGIDWYAPLTDWRDGDDHLDRTLAATIYDDAYLQGRITAGEGFDWYYASEADREAQVRLLISDGAYGEPWIYRPKDIVSWWSNAHHDRPGGVRSETATAWVPQSKPIRFIEIGCGAIDKGPNAPNLFLDPKSTESAMPPFSNGDRDDRAQRACLTAYMQHYAAHNPLSTIYGGPMLADMSVWAYDARPYPYFPQRDDVWGDTANWRTGHWLNGRMGAGEAKNLIADIAVQAGIGLDKLDLDEVTGTIDGYVIEQPMSAADALSPVLTYLGLSVAERGEGLKLIGSAHGVDTTLITGDLAYNDQSPVLTRRDLVEPPASLTLRCYDIDRDYQLLSVTVRGDAAGASQSSVDLPLTLSASQAMDYAGYALRAAQAISQTLTLDVDPLRLLELETGDGVAFGGVDYRLSQVDQGETPTVTLASVPEARSFIGADPSEASSVNGVVAGSIITSFRLLELPCFGTDEQNARPVLVPSADPWAGADVYAGASAASLRQRGRISEAASVGRMLTALPVQRRHYLHAGASFDIYLEGAGPVSRSLEEVLAGENCLCVQADNGEWEILQYLTATALGVDQYRLSGLIRGQWGTEQALLAGMSVEAEVVILPAGFVRADMALDELGLSRLWRTGRTGFGGAAADALDVTTAWSGLGLRPRAPVFGRVSGDTVSWLRSPRYGGDSWEAEPPLCEDYELYRVQVFDGEVMVREVEVSATEWTYAERSADFPGGPGADARVEIAQKSQVYGYGPVLSLALG